MYLLNIQSLAVQVATTIMASFVESSLRMTRVVRTRKLWGLITNPKFAEAQAQLVLAHPFNLHVQYLSQTLEITSIFVAFGAAMVVRVRYDQSLPLDVILSSFFIQLAVELIFDSSTMMVETSLMGFTKRAALYLEHQEKYHYFWAGIKSMVLIPTMSAVWVSCISVSVDDK